MKIGVAGDGLSLVRVFAAMAIGGAVFAGLGYLFDLVVGPAIGMSGWWTVFGSGGIILGGMLQAAREFAVPQPAERRALAAERRARRAARPATETGDAGDADDAGKNDEPARPTA
jgi:hypothetical protein